MLCYSHELGSRKVLLYIFLLFLSLTRSGFALATEIAMNFFPVILELLFAITYYQSLRVMQSHA